MEPLMLNASKTLLPDILAAHGRWVASGGKEGERADLSDAKWEEAELSAAELATARHRRPRHRPPNFSGAYLIGSDTKESSLHQAKSQDDQQNNRRKPLREK